MERYLSHEILLVEEAMMRKCISLWLYYPLEKKKKTKNGVEGYRDGIIPRIMRKRATCAKSVHLRVSKVITE